MKLLLQRIKDFWFKITVGEKAVIIFTIISLSLFRFNDNFKNEMIQTTRDTDIETLAKIQLILTLLFLYLIIQISQLLVKNINEIKIKNFNKKQDEKYKKKGDK